MNHQDIFTMRLHETIAIGVTGNAIRVPGGWLYTFDTNTTFVPFSREFMETPASELKGDLAKERLEATMPVYESRQIIITGCSKPAYWYADRIGEIFDVIKEDKLKYWTQPTGFLVQKPDCQIYIETPEMTEARANDAGQPYPADAELPDGEF